MSLIECFEDIKAWQKARVLTNEIYRISNQGMFSKDFGLRDQIRRASVPVMSNITEGYERHNKREFIRFLKIAQGFAGEVRAQLYIALDQDYINKAKFDELYNVSVETSRMIAGFIDYLPKKIKEEGKELKAE